jgi:hypothetical protein
MSIPTQQVSKVVVKPVTIPKLSKENIAGGDIFGELKYWTAFMIARKKSGKTSTINTILQQVVGPKTTVIIFCPTVNLDPTYIKIREQLQEKEINTLFYEDIYDEDGAPILENLIKAMKNIIENPPEPEIQMVVKINPVTMVKTYEQVEFVEKVEKKHYPRFIIIFDDMSHRLSDPNITRIIKIHRHIQSNIIISSQYVHDIPVGAWKNCDIAFLFRGLGQDKLELLDERLDLSVPFELLSKMYKQATEKPYSFLFINARADEYRVNFTDMFELEKK